MTAVAHDAAAERTGYAGLVTRALAFAVDGAIVNGVAVTVAAVVALGASVLELPRVVDAALVAVGGVLFVLWCFGYFLVFWSTTGQTPGDRVMRVRVRGAGANARVKPRTAVVRMAGLWLAALPLFLGFVPILIDGRRRGLHDLLAGTVVVHDPIDEPRERQAPPSEGRRTPL
jgi:uncharacterized RDD family membrane protein YckC